MKKRVYISVIVILLLLLSGAIVYIFCNQPDASPTLQTDENATVWDGEQKTPHLQNGQKGIAIPGFDTLVFIANQTQQKVNFFNPSENDCLFQMTLYVDDEAMWQSGYCAAGNGYYNIDIKKPLAAGDYSAYLQVECFKEDGTALNGAKVEFDLIVQEENNQ
jgi:hypothetical protein